MQAAEAKGPPSEDAQVLRALWNVFHTFSQPRHDLPPATSPTAGAGTATASNGNPPPPSTLDILYTWKKLGYSMQFAPSILVSV